MYRVQELAQRTGVTVKALHYYERLGLLAPSRSPGGYRIYDADHMGRVIRIVALRRLGIALKDTAELLDGTRSA